MPRISLDVKNTPVDERGQEVDYWTLRCWLVDYHTMANFTRIIANSAQSLIDVGTRDCKYIEWFDWIPDRVSLDMKFPTRFEVVRTIEADFLHKSLTRPMMS